MGENGRARVAAHYDWAIVMRQHQELWAELNSKRLKVLSDNPDYIKTAPNCAPERQDPYRVFGSFPTYFITSKTKISLGPETWRLQDWRELLVDPLFSLARDGLAGEQAVFQIINHIDEAKPYRCISQLVFGCAALSKSAAVLKELAGRVSSLDG
jgi:hypothetical protein